MPRIPVRIRDLPIGQATRWTIYDPAGTVLIEQGTLITDQGEVASLLRRRPVRDMDDVVEPATPAHGTSASAGANETRKEERVALEDLRMQPGDAIQLQGSNEEDRFVVRLIGYLKGRSLIVTNPVHEGAQVYLRDGQSFVARAFLGKQACAFPCSVMASASKPYSYVHLTYPPEVRAITVRSGERVKLRTIVAIELGDKSITSGVIVDMSIGGALMMSRSPDIAKDMRPMIKFKIDVGTVEYLMELQAQICSVRASEEDADLGQAFGIRFVDVSPEDNLVLSAFVFQRLADNQLS